MSEPGEKHPTQSEQASWRKWLDGKAGDKHNCRHALGGGKCRPLLLAASRSQTRMEPDWEPATMSSSGVLRRTLSTGDV